MTGSSPTSRAVTVDIDAEGGTAASLGGAVRPATTRLDVSAYRADIDGLRAIAVLAVVAFHAFPRSVPGGFVGVDVFFVISGYLISTIVLRNIEAGTFSFLDFYSRRIRRIFPALLVVLLASLTTGWYGLLADEFEQLGKHVAAGAAFVSNFVLWHESGYFDNAAETKPLLHLWSLGIEEQFYIAWPFLVWTCRKRAWTLPVLLLAAGIGSFGLNVATTMHDRIAAFYSPATRFWELTVGSALAYAALHTAKTSTRQAVWPIPFMGLRAVLAPAGLAMIAIALAAIDRGKAFPGWWALLPTAGTALVIAGHTSWTSRLLSNRLLVWFGLISYPLYLWHWPVLSFVRIITGKAPSAGTAGIAVLVSVVLAAITYYRVEKPIRFGGGPGGAKAAALLACMGVVGFTGYLCYQLNGLPSRTNANIVMDEHEISAERARFWNADVDRNFAGGRPKIIVFGDSQAFDIFASLKNEPAIGLRLFRSTYECTAFDLARPGQEYAQPVCEKSFDELLRSREIREADVLIYAHLFRAGYEPVERYRTGVRRLLQANPHLRLVFFGNKPTLGNVWVSINALTRRHRSPVGMNDYLNGLVTNPDPGNGVSRALAKDVGAGFVDVQSIFCHGGCPLYERGRFSYFDQDHWTQAGAEAFYRRFVRDPAYATLAARR